MRQVSRLLEHIERQRMKSPIFALFILAYAISLYSAESSDSIKYFGRNQFTLHGNKYYKEDITKLFKTCPETRNIASRISFYSVSAKSVLAATPIILSGYNLITNFTREQTIYYKPNYTPQIITSVAIVFIGFAITIPLFVSSDIAFGRAVKVYNSKAGTCYLPEEDDSGIKSNLKEY